MIFTAVNRVNFLSNNKWLTGATLGLCFSLMCHLQSCYQSWCQTGISFQIKDRCVSNEGFKVFVMSEIICVWESADVGLMLRASAPT